MDAAEYKHKLPTIGKYIDDAMDYIESLNPNMKGAAESLRVAIARINPRLPQKAQAEVLQNVLRLTV